MKLMPPCRYSCTSFERWRATCSKPIASNSGSSTPGVGEANSTNSKPIRPIGLSNRSDMSFSWSDELVEGDLERGAGDALVPGRAVVAALQRVGDRGGDIAEDRLVGDLDVAAHQVGEGAR